MGCGVCVNVCPTAAKGTLKMVAQESQLDQQPVFDYCVENIRKKDGMMPETTVKGSQFNQPLLEFSGSLRWLCRDQLCASHHPALRRADVYLQRDRLFLHLGRPAATSPYTTNKA